LRQIVGQQERVDHLADISRRRLATGVGRPEVGEAGVDGILHPGQQLALIAAFFAGRQRAASSRRCLPL